MVAVELAPNGPKIVSNRHTKSTLTSILELCVVGYSKSFPSDARKIADAGFLFFIPVTLSSWLAAPNA